MRSLPPVLGVRQEPQLAKALYTLPVNLLRGFEQICVQFVNEAKFSVQFDENFSGFRMLCRVVSVPETTLLYKSHNFPFPTAVTGC